MRIANRPGYALSINIMNDARPRLLGNKTPGGVHRRGGGGHLSDDTGLAAHDAVFLLGRGNGMSREIIRTSRIGIIPGFIGQRNNGISVQRVRDAEKPPVRVITVIQLISVLAVDQMTAGLIIKCVRLIGLGRHAGLVVHNRIELGRVSDRMIPFFNSRRAKFVQHIFSGIGRAGNCFTAEPVCDLR